MIQFQLFDSVKLKEKVSLEDGRTAPEGCIGAIVEVFNNGKAYMVELFGKWVTLTDSGNFEPSTRDVANSLMETIGVETIAPHQICLAAPASETVGDRAQLLALMDELPKNTLEEVKNFAEFLKEKSTKPIEVL